MSLLMDALKKAELAKQGKTDPDAPPVQQLPAVETDSVVQESVTSDPRSEGDECFELTLDEPELESQPEEIDLTSVKDEVVLPVETQATPAVEHKEIDHKQESAATSQPVSAEPEVRADEGVQNYRLQTPNVDVQQVQRAFVVKSRGLARRKRILMFSLGGVALLSLLGSGYLYYQNTTSTLASSLVLMESDEVAPISENMAEPVDAMGGQVTPKAVSQSTQDDIWPLPATVIAPLQGSDIASQTALVKQPASVVPDNLSAQNKPVNTIRREPQIDSRKKPVTRSAQKSKISIIRAQKTDPVITRLLEAYREYQAGNYTLAARHYHDILKQDAMNRDALLGLAAIAQRNGDREQSAHYYITLLKYDPKDSTAIAGLVSLHGASLSVENESRMKMLLDQEPQAAHLHFTLGTLYAGQSRWADAQQSFFNAHRYAAENPDYAYNLAVSLDRIGKQATALTYYRRAVKLADNQRAMFNLYEVRQRIDALAGHIGSAR